MKNIDIFAQIISEASGKPVEEVRLMTDVILKMAGSAGNMHREIPDNEAKVLLAKMRMELPGIRAWLIKGGLMMEADIAEAQGRMN